MFGEVVWSAGSGRLWSCGVERLCVFGAVVWGAGSGRLWSCRVEDLVL